MMEIYGHKWPWIKSRLLDADNWQPIWRDGMVFEVPPEEIYVELIRHYTPVKYRLSRNYASQPVRGLWMTPVRRDE